MNNIRELRRARSMTQKELADRVGTTQKRICYWERERNIPTLQNAAKIAQALGCRMEDLIQEKRNEAS